MPAKSKAQQKAAGAALSAKRGDTNAGKLKGASRQMYETMTEGQLDEFASTGRRGKPEHVADAAGSARKSAAKKSASRAVKARPRTVAKKTPATSMRKSAKKTSVKSAAPAKKKAARRRAS